MSDVELELVARMSDELEQANFPTPIPEVATITRLEAMEELTVRLNNARTMREFSYKNWGEESAYRLWEKDVRLFDYLLDNLKECKGCEEDLPLAHTCEASVTTSANPQANPTSYGQTQEVTPNGPIGAGA